MKEKVLVINQFNENDNPRDYVFDISGKSYTDSYFISEKNEGIPLEEIFDVSVVINYVKDVTILLCQKTGMGKSVVVACMKNAEIYRNSFDANWLFDKYNIVCDADDCFFLEPNERDYYYRINNFTFDDSKKTMAYIDKICQNKNCVKFDSTEIDKKISKAKTIKELTDLSIELDDAFQYKKTLDIWEKEYAKDNNNPEVIYQLAISKMDCKQYEEARQLFESVFEEYKDENFYLSRLAVLYFIRYYTPEAIAIADMIKDRSLLDEWDYSYEYIKSFAPVYINTESIMNNEVVKHKINLGIMDMPLPETITTKSGECYLDPIRKKGIPATKEEEVRQKVLRYLMDVLEIPEANIKSEDAMAHYEKNATTRADITVRNGDTTYLIVECKEPSVNIDGEPIRQLFGYNDKLLSKFLLLTNGRDSYIFQQSGDGGYDSVMKLPKFSEMLAGKKLIIPSIKKSNFKRPSLKEMQSRECIKRYKDDGAYVGINTDDKLVPFILNLAWAFLDAEDKLPKISGYGVTIVKDNGIVYETLSNASGGKFSGYYRQFIVKDRKGETVIVSFLVSGTLAISDTKGGYTSLVCGVNHASSPIARLELRFDACCEKKLFSTYLFHNGVRSRKKCQTTIDYVYSICSQLVKDNRINLGTFPDNKLISTKDKNVQDFILRLTSYVLLRDEMSLLKL